MIGTYHCRGRCTDTFSGDVCLQGICFAILWVSEIDDFYLIHQSVFEAMERVTIAPSISSYISTKLLFTDSSSIFPKYERAMEMKR